MLRRTAVHRPLVPRVCAAVAGSATACLLACARPPPPSPVADGSLPNPRDAASPSAPDEPETSDLAISQRAVMRALVSCSYNPRATPYGLEYEWFRATVTYAANGEPLSARVVRVADGKADPKVTACLVARLRSGGVALSPADATRDVVYPLDGRWR